MGMVIRHNLMAQNANNALNGNVLGTKKATEKLSTGYQINRAGDNASGLAVSEKMRAQIGGLTQAVKNVQDGISLIQTAEGGLNETQAILQRMRDLHVQGSNGVYQQEDRDAIQSEVEALKSEIDRISDSTEFNGLKLLDGSLSGVGGNSTTYGPRFGVLISANTTTGGKLASNLSLEGATIESSVSGVKLTLKADNTSGKGGETAEWDPTGKELTLNLTKGSSYTQSQINDLIKNANQADGALQTNPVPDFKLNLKNGVFTFADDENFTTQEGIRASHADVAITKFLLTAGSTITDSYADKISLTSNNYGEDVRKITIKTDVAPGKEEATRVTDNNEDLGIKDGEFELHLSTGKEYSESDIEKILKKAGLDYSVKLTDTSATGSGADGDTKFYANTKETTGVDVVLGSTVTGAGLGADKTFGSGEGLTFQIGANGVEDQRVTLNVDDMDSAALGVQGLSVATVADSNQGINKIDEALNTVSLQRARLGAMQNRLEHTNNNLNTTNENLTAAESSIRDTDVATEMINYTKFNILQQAAQSMLAQANQAPQAALQLLG